MALSIAHGSKLLDLSGPMGKQQELRMSGSGDEETGSEDDDQPKAAGRGRRYGMIKWLGLNAVRLLGVVAICWTIGVQLILLGSDVKGANAGMTSSNISLSSNSSFSSGPDASDAASTATSLLITASDIPKTPPTTSFDIITAAETDISTSDAAGQAVPQSSLLLYTSMAGTADTALPAGATPSMITPDGGTTLRRRSVQKEHRDETAAGAMMSNSDATATPGGTSSTVSAGNEYFLDTTVPTIKGGLLFALTERLSMVAILVIALLGQTGLPGTFLLKYLAAFSMSSTPAAVGLCQYFVGLSMQRAYVKQAYLLPSYLLMVAGLLNLHIASYLVVMERMDRKKGRIYVFNRYQRFHGIQRILFWTALPNALVPAVPSNPFVDERPSGMKRKNSEQILDEKIVEAERNTERAAQMQGYPTFRSGGINGATSQIPRLGEDGLLQHVGTAPKAGFVRDEEEEEEERLALTAPPARKSKPQAAPPISKATRLPVPIPPISPLISDPSISPLVQNPAAKGVPIRLQQLMQAPPSEPIGQLHAETSKSLPPSINLIPSTASTMATGRTGNFPNRPDTIFSAISDQSSGSDRSTILRQAAQSLPSPRIRYEGPARARPKEHLVNRPMDDSRLMPVKGAMRKAAQTQNADGSPSMSSRHHRGMSAESVLDLSGVEVRAPVVPPSPNRQTWGASGDIRDASFRAARSRSIRFDVRKDSEASAISVDSGLSVSSGLSEFLPAIRTTATRSPGRYNDTSGIPPRGPPPSQPPPPAPAGRGSRASKAISRQIYERLDSVSSSDDASDLDTKRYSVASVYMDAKEVPSTPYRGPPRSQVSPEPGRLGRPGPDDTPPHSSRSGQSTSGSSAEHAPQRRRR